ncbi:hypothetical protein GUJ93_ZPchr0013g37606 [Zizania palustris]|uniref:Uncharacterized protein n=1 Tax=Zizania palustris TaxID=103762 RepID=A0A8J5X045_ZIZPA|nr:hypothetical protein GUJ93_ZPchr0013g37606 [Zizania palustris]
MASVGFGTSVAAVAAAAAGRRRRTRVSMVAPVAATRGQPAAKEEKSLADFIFGAIFKENQLLETDPLLNKVDGAPSSGTTGSRKAAGTTGSRKAAGTTSGRKKPAADADDEGSGGGFNLGGLFAKKG